MHSGYIPRSNLCRASGEEAFLLDLDAAGVFEGQCRGVGGFDVAR